MSDLGVNVHVTSEIRETYSRRNLRRVWQSVEGRVFLVSAGQGLGPFAMAEMRWNSTFFTLKLFTSIFSTEPTAMFHVRRILGHMLCGSCSITPTSRDGLTVAAWVFLAASIFLIPEHSCRSYDAWHLCSTGEDNYYAEDHLVRYC